VIVARIDPLSRLSGPASRSRRASEPGFTLIEVLVASLILAIALIALSGLFALGIKNNAVAKEDTVMTSFAQDKLEDLKRQPLSELQKWFVTSCQEPCAATCDHPCYAQGCAAADRVYKVTEDPIPDPNPQDDVHENLYVREWQLQRVNLGQPVGCVLKVTVLVGSRNGIMSPKPASPATTWLDATTDQVLGVTNPRRVVISSFRAR